MSGLLTAAIDVLSGWAAPSPAQAALREDYLEHLRVHPDGLWRDGPPAHLTASCFVLDPTGTRTLLTLHRRGGFWVQFGGHLEASDRTLADAALREAQEESGVRDLSLLPTGGAPVPVDLDRHALSSRFDRCAEHLDVAFVAVTSAQAQPVVSDESDDVAWWPLDALPPGLVPDLPPRLLRAADLVRTAAAAERPR